MKNSQKGLALPLIIAIIAVVATGIGVYVYLQKKSKVDRSNTIQTTIKYKMVSTANAKYSYPLITDYANKTAMDKANQTLIETFKDFGCAADAPEGESVWNVKISVDYAKNDIFSVNASGDYYCGGAYPTNNYSSTLTFDMKTGDRIAFEKLFKNYEKDKAQIINTIYGDVIAKANNYAAKQSIDDAPCESVNTYMQLSSSSHGYRLSPTAKIVYIRPNYPHAIEACIEEVGVPTHKLLPFADTTSVLNRM